MTLSLDAELRQQLKMKISDAKRSKIDPSVEASWRNLERMVRQFPVEGKAKTPCRKCGITSDLYNPDCTTCTVRRCTRERRQREALQN